MKAILLFNMALNSFLLTGIYANDNYNGVHHVGVLCKDISESLKFYRNILGEQFVVIQYF